MAYEFRYKTQKTMILTPEIESFIYFVTKLIKS